MPTPNETKDSSPSSTCSPSILSQFYLTAVPAAMGGTIDLAVFHPIDTITARLQRTQAILPFQVEKWKDTPKIFSSFYQGFQAAFWLKMSQRLTKYGVEPVVQHKIQDKFPDMHPVTTHLLSGALVGVTESLVFTPFDAIKFQMQAKTEKGGSYTELWKAQKSNRFTAFPITAIRNCLGLGSFFGAHSFLRHYAFGLKEEDKLSYQQKLISSAICPPVAHAISYPTDLIKTRVQTSTLPVSAMSEFKNIIINDGVSGLYKGMLSRLIPSFPRGCFSFMTIQVLTDWFKTYNHNKEIKISEFKNTLFQPSTTRKSTETVNNNTSSNQLKK